MRRSNLFWQAFLSIGLLALAGGCAEKNESGKKAITVWHWMTDREPAFQELAKRYEAKTGVKVTFELYAPSDAYTQKVRAAAQGSTLPDIFGILGEKRDFASFIKAGFISDLTPYMDADGAKWRNGFFSKALAVNEFTPGNSYGVTPGIYGAPIDIMTIQMVYNKSIYEAAGLDPAAPPQSWEDFIEHARVLKEKGIPGFVSGFGEIWMLDALASNFAMNVMGPEKDRKSVV